VDHFIDRFSEADGRSRCTLDQSALRLLMEYDWPGNVRELENAIERAVVLAPSDNIISQELLPSEIMESTVVSLGRLQLGSNGVSLKDLVTEFEKDLILTALKKAGWNQKKAAHLLRVNATTLNEKLKRFAITLP
jgi:transcriptional regulator with PAS, ATPase and Fis domain